MPDLRAAEPLSDEEMERYERQLRLDGFGLGAQHRLQSSTAFVSRVGGVGGSAAAQLARAGIGRLVLAHGGPVHREYMNRWPLAMDEDVGRPASEAVAERLRAINPHTKIVAVGENVCETNVTALIERADVIVDGAPLFEERYLMNAEALAQGKPMVSGAMYATDGYVTTFIPGRTGCLRCLFADRPPDWTSIGVFPAIGPGPAMVGAMAAMEAIKLLTGFGTPLADRLWTFDLADNGVRVLRIERSVDCPACGTTVAVDTTRTAVPNQQ